MRFRLSLLSLSTALLTLASCGRTESLIELGDEVAEGETFSFEDTATTAIADEDSSSSVSESSSDDLTTDWGDDVLDTWGDDPDAEWGETFDSSTDIDTFDSFDTFDSSTDVDTFDTFDTVDTFDTSTDVDTFDTSTDVDTFDTSTDVDTFDTSTDVDTVDTSTTATTSTTDPGPTCADAAQCLIDCGNFGNGCTGPCSADLDADQSGALFDLQICAVQSCFFLGLCDLGDFNAPECVQCRFDVNADPEGFGCATEGMACGI